MTAVPRLHSLQLFTPSKSRILPRGYNPAGLMADDKEIAHMGAPAPDSTVPNARPRIFDGSVNIPTLLTTLTMVVTCVGTCFGVYQSFDRRLSALEDSDRQQELHFQRLEASQAEFKSEIKDTLRTMNGTLQEIRDRVIAGSPASRPETRQWTRN